LLFHANDLLIGGQGGEIKMNRLQRHGNPPLLVSL
jgi:hypothetical protein